MEELIRRPYKHDTGQKITTVVKDVDVDRAYIAHYHIDAEDAPAESETAVMALTTLGAQATSITAGLTSPAVPRNAVVDGSAANAAGNVKVYGTNFAGDAINETIALNGQTAKAGNLAFASFTKVDLPARTNTPAKQTETIQVTAGCGTSGDITVAVTATTLLGTASPASVTVTLDSTTHSGADDVAAAVVDALNEDEDIGSVFIASVTGEGVDTVLLTAKAYAANDATLAIAFTVGSTQVTVGSSTNGTTGVAEDKVSVGIGKKFGLPYKLAFSGMAIAAALDSTPHSGDAVTADIDELEKNVFTPNGSPDGLKDIDLYLIV